jgi:hypothetical protein
MNVAKCNIHLAHDFQQVETLPENDRTRYTITPQACKGLLTRLLKLNHPRTAEEKSGAQMNNFHQAKAPQLQRARSPDELI